MSAFELKANVAANLAQAVYGLREGTNVAAAMVATAPGAPNLHDTVDVGQAKRIGGVSGFGAKSGFGMVSPVSGRQGEYLVVCRGTQTGSDWLSNGNVGVDRGPGGIPMHQGFHKVYKSMREQVMAELKGKNPSRIHVVGHSLGGAIANIFAVDFATQKGLGVKLYTFGAPRIAGTAMVGSVEQMIGRGNTRRVLAISDVVPMVPLWPFGHYADGAHRFDPGMGKLSLPAHYMDASYIPACRGGWPAPMPPQPPKSVEYWLEKSMNAGGPLNAFALYALEKALGAILKGVGIVIQSALTVSFTMVDWLAQVLTTAGQRLKRAGEQVAGWIMAAMKFLGREVVIKAGDVTTTLVRAVLDRFYRTLANIARRAIDRFV